MKIGNHWWISLIWVHGLLFLLPSTDQTPHLSPPLILVLSPALTPPFPSLTAQMLPNPSPPSLLLSIPPFSPPPLRSPLPSQPLPRSSRPPSSFPPLLHPAPLRHSHSCPPPVPPPLPTPTMVSQRQSARPLLLKPRLPRSQQIFCCLSHCRLNLYQQKIMNPVITAQLYLRIQIFIFQILLQPLLILLLTRTNQLLVCRALYRLMVDPHLLPSPLFLHTCKVCPFRMCPPTPPTPACTSKTSATKCHLLRLLQPSLHAPSLIPLPLFHTLHSSPPPTWQSPLPSSSPPQPCHRQCSTLKSQPIPPLHHTLQLT